MTIQIIQTTQAPEAKPIGISISLTDEWETVIEVPSYEIPEGSPSSNSVIVPAGVAEIISPMLVSNKTDETSLLSIRIHRHESNTSFFIVNELPIAASDLSLIPLNGQFMLSGGILEVKSSANNDLDITISYTLGQAEQDNGI